MDIEKPITVDLLDTSGAPALSSTSDVPVIETKPDAQNEGAPPAAAPVKDAEQPGESATPATEEPAEGSEQSGEPAKPKESRGVQKALDRLAAEREEQRKRAEAAEEREKQLLEVLNKGKQPEVEPPPAEVESAEPKRPSRQDYADEDSYQAALDTYVDERAAFVARKTLEQERAEAARKAEQEQIEAGARAAQEKYVERRAKAMEKYPDYVQVAESQDVKVSEAVGLVLLHAENGPDLQHYLGSNPKEAERLLALPVPLQLMELGLIGAKLAAPAAAPAPEKPKPVISSAPPPIKPTRTSSEPPAKNPEEMSMDEYAAHRRKQQAEARTRH